ncbi:hypothetical protein BDR06DRAFT_967404 [Suillus hirtellus]|nr:hypothetical protein BDR06DRAFT_967404 [Suillus hirtellus]
MQLYLPWEGAYMVHVTFTMPDLYVIEPRCRHHAKMLWFEHDVELEWDEGESDCIPDVQDVFMWKIPVRKRAYPFLEIYLFEGDGIDGESDEVIVGYIQLAPTLLCSSHGSKLLELGPKLHSGWLTGGGGGNSPIFFSSSPADLYLLPSYSTVSQLVPTLLCSSPGSKLSCASALHSASVFSVSHPLCIDLIAGLLNINDELVHIPMATVGGTLVASTETVLTKGAMIRGPAINFPSIVMAAGVTESESHLDWGLREEARR